MSRALGHNFVDADGDIAYTCVYTGSSTKEVAEGYKDGVEYYLARWHEEDFDIYVDSHGSYSNIEEMEEDEDLISEEVYEIQQKRAKQVLAALKDIEGLDLSNLIVRGNRVMSGYDECENYISQSHTWLSSSMMC